MGKKSSLLVAVISALFPAFLCSISVHLVFESGFGDAFQAGQPWENVNQSDVQNFITSRAVNDFSPYGISVSTSSGDLKVYIGRSGGGFGYAVTGIGSYIDGNAYAEVYSNNFANYSQWQGDNATVSRIGEAIAGTASHEAGHLLNLYHAYMFDSFDPTIPATLKSNYQPKEPEYLPSSAKTDPNKHYHLMATRSYITLEQRATIDRYFADNSNQILKFAEAGGSDIYRNATWGIDNRTFSLANDITVASGKTLIIASGGYIHSIGPQRVNSFDSNATLDVRGTLKAEGTSVNPVTFTSASTTPSRGDWEGITLNGAGSNNSVLRYTNVTYAITGIWLDDSEPQIENCTIENNSMFGMYVKDSYTSHWNNPNFTSNTIRNTSVYAVTLSNSSPTMENNSIDYNDSEGLYGYGASTKPVLESNSITNNDKHGMRWHGSSSPYIYYNSSQTYGGCNVVVNNGISSSYDGVHAHGSSYPQMGTSSTNPGNNKIYNNTGYEVSNSNGGSTYIYAKNNWWGSSGPSPGDFEGLVRYTPYLSSEPCAFALNESPFKLQIDYLPLYFATGEFQWYDDAGSEFNLPIIAALSPLMANQMTITPQDYIDMAIELYDQGLLREARETFAQVLTYFPATEAARFSLQYIITIMEDLGQRDQVLQYLAELSSTNQRNALGWFADLQRVFILGHGGKYEEALQLVESVLQDSRKDPELSHSLALYKATILSSHGMQRNEDATVVFNDFLASNPPEDLRVIAQVELQRLTGDARTLPKRGVGQTSGVESPIEFNLFENHPNPFNSATVIRYELPFESKVLLRIYDIMGREIRTLVNGQDDAGHKNVMWDGTDNGGNPVSSGMYLYYIEARSLESDKIFSQIRKMLLLR